MIILGTYPDCVQGRTPAIQATRRVIGQAAPPGMAVHLLPFGPSSGDDGFAPDDWMTVRTDLGDWSDVAAIAGERPLIVDGIYNHVGVNHAWFKAFVDDPFSARHRFHVFERLEVVGDPLSPKGRPVLVPYEIDGQHWHVWQAFNSDAADLRLDSVEVLSAIEDHLRLLQDLGVWGVRLDAVAYYAKSLTGGGVHNPGCPAIASRIAALCHARRLRVIAQLDCDEFGLRYLKAQASRFDAINDFTFSAYLALAILLQNAEIISSYLQTTSPIRRILVRSPRTHDGLLLRSALMDPLVRERLVAMARAAGIEAASVEDVPYELNCSAPYLYAQPDRQHQVNDLIDLAVAITGMSAGWAYLFAPFLLGFTPELFWLKDESHPRSLNRARIPESEMQRIQDAGRLGQVRQLLEALEYARGPRERLADATTLASTFGRSGLEVATPGSPGKLYANLSSSESVSLRLPAKRHVYYSRGFANGQLAPLGFVISEHQK